MDLRSIFVANGIGIFILLILLYASHARILRDHLEDRVYSFLIFGVMAGCFCEAFSYAIDGKVFPCSRILNYAANTYLYSCNLMLPLCVLIYSDLRLYENPSRIWKRYKPQIILGAVMISLNIINFFTPIIYYISSENIYSRRPLSYSFYAVIMYFLISTIFLIRSYEKQNGTRPFLNIYIFMFPILIGAGLQFMFYGLSLAWVSSAIGLVGLFMMMQNELAYMDPLVGTYNRQYMNYILDTWIHRGEPFAGVMVDIDRFKQVNDNYGHAEGDHILKILADILKASRREQEWVFRFAGDEFIILKLTHSEDELKAYMAEVNRRVDEYNRHDLPYRLALSYGISSFKSGELDSFMRDMDTKMYAMKEGHHAHEQEFSH